VKTDHPAPRQVARQLFETFLSTRSTEGIVEQLPEHLRGLATDQARNMAALVIHHARRAREDRGHLSKLRPTLRAAVVKYNAALVARERRKAA
jgi:hypothetical protein